MDKFDLQKHMLRHCHCSHDIFYVYDRLYYLYYHCGYDLVVLRQATMLFYANNKQIYKAAGYCVDN